MARLIAEALEFIANKSHAISFDLQEAQEAANRITDK